MENLENGYSVSRNKCPKDLQSVYTCLISYRFDIQNYSEGLELTTSRLTYINNQLNGVRSPSGRGKDGGKSNSRGCGHGGYYRDNKRKSEEASKKSEANKNELKLQKLRKLQTLRKKKTNRKK